MDKTSKNLVIVESPNKRATLMKIFTDAGYKNTNVMATYGHFSIIKDGGKYWNTGIGSALFEVMIDLAKKHECTEIITLEYVAGNNRGRGLYQKFGFKPYGVAPKMLKFKDGSYGDEVLMVKFLEK